MDQIKNQETETKKPYTAPQLMEHGTVEEITGFRPDFSHSGATE